MINTITSNHLKKLVEVFTNDNNILLQHIYKLPPDISFEILTLFIGRMSITVPHPMINKEELSSMSNTHNRHFTQNFQTIIGRSRIYSHLDIIANIITYSSFNEIEYDDIGIIFQSQLGFIPSKHYIHRLRNMFPDSKLFSVIHLELLDMGTYR